MGSRHLFSALAAQLLEYLASRGLAFGQLTSLLRACCPTSRVFGFPRTWFLAAGTSSPRLLPISSSNQLPASLLLGGWHLFTTLAAQLLEHLASRGLAFGQLTLLLRACCPNSLPADHCGTGFGTFKTQNRGNQLTSPTPQRKRAHTGSFSQIVSILGEVKLVNVCIRALALGGQILHRSWHLGSH